MANLIRIKRSETTAAPATLANGELAWSGNSKVLYIGANDVVEAIGGKRFPGTLTANHAIVVNSTSMINTIQVGNSTANVVLLSTGLTLANTTNTVSIGPPSTAEKGGAYYLKADGSWSTVTGATADPAGSNTHVQYNDSGVMNGVAGFTYDESTNNVFVANTLLLGTGTSNASANLTTVLIQSNSTTWARLTESTLRLSNTVSNTQLTVPSAAERAGSYYLKADGTWALVAAGVGGGDTQVQFNDGGSAANGSAGFTFTKSTNNVLIANTVSAAVVNTAGVMANATALVPTANTILLGGAAARWVVTANSVATQGFSGNATDLSPTSNTITLGGATARWVVTANSVATQGLTGNATTLSPTSNTITLGAAAARWVITANSVATQGVEANATALNPTANTILLGNATGQWVVTANTVSAVSVTTGTSVINSTQMTVAGGPFINSTTLSVVDALISGNLDVNGTLTTFDTTNLAVNDSIIELARENGGATLDIGMYGQYNDGTPRFTGLIWDMDQLVYELFANTATEPTTTLNTAGTGFVRAKMQAYLRSGWGSGLFEANSTGITLTGNSTYAVAITGNTLTLSTVLAPGSGGTGQGTYVAGDLLYGNTTPALDKLSRGADGTVLQANSTSILWGELDGGTY